MQMQSAVGWISHVPNICAEMSNKILWPITFPWKFTTNPNIECTFHLLPCILQPHLLGCINSQCRSQNERSCFHHGAASLCVTWCLTSDKLYWELLELFLPHDLVSLEEHGILWVWKTKHIKAISNDELISQQNHLTNGLQDVKS